MKLLIEALERRALLSGEIDTTFGTNGVATGDFDAYSERLTAVTTDSAGRIYGAGFINGGYLLARYLPNGQVDSGFGVTSPGFVRGPTTNYAADGVAVSPTTGKIYVAGSQYVSGAVTNACVVAFNADGSIDTTFDGDGVWSGKWNGASSNFVLGVAYANNRLYVGTSDYSTLGVACFTDSGTLDPAFDGDGKAMFTANTKPVGFDYEPSIAGTGPLLVVGRDGNKTIAVKYNLNGTRDTTFATSTLPDVVAAEVSLDNTGRVLIANYSDVTRLDNKGQVDGTFGLGGTYHLPFTSATKVTSLTDLGSTGTFVTAYAGGGTGSFAEYAISLTTNGQPNQSFADNGLTTFPNINVAAATVHRGGIVLAGRLSKGADLVDTQLLRFNRPPAASLIGGHLFDDVNADGKNNDTGGSSTFYGIAAYLDLDNSGTLTNGEPTAYAGTGTFQFDNVELYKQYTVRLHVYPGINAVQTFPVAGGGYTVTPLDAVTLATPFGVHFGPLPPAGAAASGIVFNDANQNGKHDPGEAGIADVVMYVDVDNDKVQDADEVATRTDGTGGYGFSNLADTGTATRLRSIVPAGGKQTTPVDGKGYGLTFTAGVTNAGLNFGVYTPSVGPALGSLSGFAFDDTDKDGVFDSTEKKTSGKTVFLDLDNDGVLDSNETKITTASDGSWIFGNLAAGTYHVRRVFPSGYTLSTTPIDVTLTAGQVVGGLAIGSKSGTVTPPVNNTASITGSVFNDNNKNGKYDSGDGYAKGVVVFLDTDNDGKLDSGETSVTTDSTGKFGFTKLAAGTYRVRRVMPTGYTYSTTKPDVTLTNSQAKSGVLIGTKKS